MSDPLRKANFTRNCWIEFDSEENCNKAAMSMNGLMIKNETLNVSKAFTKVKKVKVLKNYPISRLESDIEIMAKLIEKLDSFCGITNNDLLNKVYRSPQNKYDIFILYLRKIHSFDYYTCTQYEN